MGFRLAPCLVLWDFKTDGWPPVPISKPSPRPRSPWIELRLALAMLRPWFDGISAGTLSVLWGFKTDGWPFAPISKPSPRPRAPWMELRLALAWFRLAPCPAAGFSMVSAGTLAGFMGFQN